MAIFSKTIFNARASLVDRLVDENPKLSRERRPLRTLNRKRLRESVRRDLTWLLNTRTSLPGARYDKTDLTVIDYGMPDFGAYYTDNEEDHQRLVQRLLRAISVFEPRLQNVKVAVELMRINEKALRVVLDAMLVIDNVKTPVSFLAVLKGETATVTLNANR